MTTTTHEAGERAKKVAKFGRKYRARIRKYKIDEEKKGQNVWRGRESGRKKPQLQYQTAYVLCAHYLQTH